jgi:CO/xanthine dehydrogenase FAD-binding subunit
LYANKYFRPVPVFLRPEPIVLGYVRPTILADALACLAQGNVRIAAGCTDLYPATTFQSLPGNILDITAIEVLRGVSTDDAHYRIGAATTWTDIIRTDLPSGFDQLKQAAREVGSVQIQNAATIGGNLCNASPAADGVPALLVLDARVELSAKSGKRTIPLADFITGPRQTTLQPDELLTAVLIPTTSAQGRSVFLKLGARKYLVISIAMVAARLREKNGHIADAAISVGSCSAVAARLRNIETLLVGKAVDPNLATKITNASVRRNLSPISDTRGDAGYREEAAAELVRRAVGQLLAKRKPVAA